jgi:hypothetical protein
VGQWKKEAIQPNFVLSAETQALYRTQSRILHQALVV